MSGSSRCDVSRCVTVESWNCLKVEKKMAVTVMLLSVVFVVTVPVFSKTIYTKP